MKVKCNPSRFGRVLSVLVLANMAFAASAGDLYVGPGQTYETIQAAVDVAGSGDVIHVAEGVYDVGATEDSVGGMSNRVVISSKTKLTIVGAGRGKTIVRGSRPAGLGDAISANMTSGAAVRCLRIVNCSDMVISDMTFERGEVKCANITSGQNGGAVYATGPWVSTVVFVDCDMSDSAAPTSGLVEGGKYVRCRLESGFGSYSGVADNATFVNCAVSCSTSYNKNLFRNCALYNCTIADCRATYLLSGANSKAVNCLIVLFSGTLFDGTVSGASLVDCVVGDTAAHGDWQVMAPTLGDVNPLPTADVFGASAYANLDELSLPTGISKYVDLNGQAIVADGQGKITAGAVQNAGVPAAGTLVFKDNGYPVINGKRSRCDKLLTWICPSIYPVQYKVSVSAKASNATFFRWQRSVDNGYQYVSLDGSEWLMPPPDTSVTNTYAAETITDKLWVDDARGNDATGAINNENLPFKTIQAAITKAATSWPRIIYVKPGWYTNGLASAGAKTRFLVTSDKILIRSTGGADVTFLGGAPASPENQDEPETYPGSGSDAIRAFDMTGTSALQGFTILNSYAQPDTGAVGCNTKQQLLDCVFSNCVSRSYAVQADCTRCRFHHNISTRDLVAGNNTSASYFRDNVTVDSNFGAIRNAAIFCTVVGPVRSGYISSQVSSFNSVYDGGTRVATNWKPFGSLFWNYAECGVDLSKFISADPLFVDRAATPQLYALSPAVAGGVYPTVENTADVKWYLYCHGDLYGNPIDWGTEGRPTIGAAQVTKRPCLYIKEPADGGIALEGAVFGVQGLDETATFTVLPAVGTRPCIGVTVNGELRSFTNGWSEAKGRYEIVVAGSEAEDGLLMVEAVYSTDWYADDDGDDANPGSLPKLAKKTLAVAEAMMADNDTLHVLPGTYDEGSNRVNQTTVWSRLVVRCNHTVVSTDGPEKTFIVGADATISPDEYGCGTNAVRCATVCKNATLSGFTLTGGRVDGTKVNNVVECRGGGVLGESGAGSLDPNGLRRVENCIISNCVANIGGAASNCHLLRTCIVNNTGTRSGAVYDVNAYGCYFGGNCGACVLDHSTDAIGCTVDADNLDSAGKAASAVTAPNDGTRLINSLFLVPLNLTTASACFVTNTAYLASSRVTGENVVIDADTCIATNVEALVLADGVPVVGQNVAIDRGNPSAFTDEDGFLDPDHDLRGFQRIMNGAMDIGCYEADWSARYAKDLGRAVVVENASAAVYEDPEARKVVLPAESTLSFDWAVKPGKENLPRVFSFTVTSGTMYVARNGGEPVAYPAGSHEIKVDGGAVENFALTMSADGLATLEGCRQAGGLVLIFR